MNCLLNRDQLNRIPGSNNVIAFDGEKKSETLLIIIAEPQDKEILENLADPEEINSKIASILNNDFITDNAPKMINLGGNFRNLGKSENVLKKYSGEKYIYKEFHFEVRR